MREPMLAATIEDIATVRFPLLASVKFDGIRAVTTENGPMSRSGKPIRNRIINRMMRLLPPGLDGELVCFVDGKMDFRGTNSQVMRKRAEPDFKYFVFDMWDRPFASFEDRLAMLRNRIMNLHLSTWVRYVDSKLIHDPKQAEFAFTQALLAGYEGLILRDPNGLYKYGRSTLIEQGMLKLKPWNDDEAICIAVLEAYENTNIATLNAFGRQKRSSHKAGKIGKGTMGKLVLQSPRWPQVINVGGGFTDEQRKIYWENPPIGKIIKFKYIKVGNYDMPRSPQFVGERHPDDTGA